MLERKSLVIIDKTLGLFESVVTVVCFIVMSCLVLAGIVSRFFLHVPFIWVEEASRYLMITAIVIGISAACRKKAHIGLTFFVDALPPKGGKVIAVTARVIEVFAYLVLIVSSIVFIQRIRKFDQRSAAMLIPMWIVYFPLLVGFVISLIRTLMLLWNDFIAKDKVLPEESYVADQ